MALLRFRNAALLHAAITLFWLQLEDNHILPVVLVGTVWAALLAFHWLRRARFGAGLRGWLVTAFAGGLWGALAAVITALLMVLKAGMHGHVNPDFLPGQVLAMLGLTPLWALAGALVVVGGLALRRAGGSNGTEPQDADRA